MKTTAARIALSVASLAGAASAQSFTPMGDLPGGTFYSLGGAISPNGQFATGYSDVGGNQRGFRWAKPTGAVSLSGAPANLTDSQAYGISGDGLIVFGQMKLGANANVPFRWTQAGGMVAMPATPWPDNSATLALRTSFDGSAVAGTTADTSTGFNGAYRWTASGGYTQIPLLPGASSGVGYGLSGNGATVVGYCWVGSDHRAFRWSPAGGTTYLGDLPGGLTWSEANNVSFDGRTIVGSSYSANGGEPFIWTASSGMVSLGNFPAPVPNGGALACSGDGSVVVGYSNNNLNETTAFVWDASHGMRTLAAVLSSVGAGPPHGWKLTYAYGISYDGSTIVGTGLNPSGNTEGFVARIKRTCPGDINGDGVVNTIDLGMLLSAFGTSVVPLLNGDLDGSGAVNTLDLGAFLSLFGTSCPA